MHARRQTDCLPASVHRPVVRVVQSIRPEQTAPLLQRCGDPMRARDLCGARDLPTLPKNTEGIWSKLKRLVTRGVLTEPEPGLFAQPGT
ncbi:hypothetical protein [Streptomyces candidus]|uniref:Uncharacterized protein n=1 Tax=Streptomyces candidus TaxID=67283 RepID=A0A7X0LSV3_9ACTN|nr:hypothetical protein [Streptomyces candidus]MBB6439602.1 hypothetical protein [Streptomyces candidus]